MVNVSSCDVCKVPFLLKAKPIVNFGPEPLGMKSGRTSAGIFGGVGRHTRGREAVLVSGPWQQRLTSVNSVVSRRSCFIVVFDLLQIKRNCLVN